MKTLVVAPHPDDETLGCGGTMLAKRAAGHELHWAIITSLPPGPRRDERDAEIERVAERYGIEKVWKADFETTRLDTLPLGDVIGFLSRVVSDVQPAEVYLPFPGDAHSDHSVVFKAASACTKSFRYPSIRCVLCYETPSETDFGIDPTLRAFTPNRYCDISAHLDAKVDIMRMFAGEIDCYARREEIIRSLATYRGGACGTAASEAFMVLRELKRYS